MNNVTIYEVSTPHPSVPGLTLTRLTTLNGEEAKSQATKIYKAENVIPDIMCGEFTPKDHTTGEAKAERAAELKRAGGSTMWTRLADDAARIRAAKTKAAASLPSAKADQTAK